MEEVARNLHNFKLDHDYYASIPLEEPRLQNLVETLEENTETLQKPVAGPIILDNTLLVPSSKPVTVEQIQPTTATIPVTDTQPIPETTKPSTATYVSKSKAKLINTEKQATLKETPRKSFEKSKVKEKPKIVQQIEREFGDSSESEEYFENEDFVFEDDDNDSDFQVEQPKAKTKRTPSKRKTQLRERTLKGPGKTESKQHKTEHKPKESKAPPLKAQEVQEQPKVLEKEESIEKEKISTSVPDKKVQKKEKKIPKPIPNDFMLFSTPDIIKRVGSKDSQAPVTPTGSSLNSPAKISSRLSSGDQSSVTPNKSNRTSVDSKLPEKQKQETKNKDRRQSSDKSRKNSVDDKGKNDTKKETATRSNAMQDISLGTMDLALAPEDIRSIIMTEDVKSYTTSTLPLVQTSEISSTESVDQNIALDDLDQSILDNINNDEISEDILYQVAQSLVGNTDLQKAIDTGLTEGNLLLDPTLQESITPRTAASQANNSQVICLNFLLVSYYCFFRVSIFSLFLS